MTGFRQRRLFVNVMRETLLFRAITRQFPRTSRSNLSQIPVPVPFQSSKWKSGK